MPVVRPYGSGGVSATSPPCNLRRTITLAADPVVNTTPILVEGMPHLFLWALQTTVGAVATMLWQWSARSVTGVLTPTDDWQPVFPAATTFLIASSNVYYERAAFSAKRIRLQLTRSPGIPTVVEVFYGATL